MRVLEKLKSRALRLKKEIAAIYYAYRDPGTPLLPKIIIAVTLGYALSPIDLIPDFIPVLGYLDDLIIIPALISLSIRLIPCEIMEEARRKADHESLRLRRNWIFAIIFILIWISLIAVMVVSISRIF